MIVDKGELRKIPGGRRYDGRALFLFDTRNPLRSALISLTEDEWFDRVVLLVIVANCAAREERTTPNRI